MKNSTKKVVGKVKRQKIERLPKVKELAKVSLAIVAKFSISQIVMKNDWRWKIKMLVHETLPKAYHDYAIKLEFDDAPFLKSIAQLEKQIAEIKSAPGLLPDIDARNVRETNKRLTEVKIEMEKMRKECTDIEFVTQSEEIKYKDGDTALLFKVLDSVIQPLNEKKHRLNDYRAVMDPIIK